MDYSHRALAFWGQKATQPVVLLGWRLGSSPFGLVQMAAAYWRSQDEGRESVVMLWMGHYPLSSEKEADCSAGLH